MPRIEFGKHTDVGRVRRGNEDSFDVVSTVGTVDAVARITLLAVADGMGGHNAGEVASAMAVEWMIRQLFGEDAGGVPAMDADRLRQAVETANRAVWTASQRDRAHEGMGTTLVCALVRESGELVLANVGDSRAYLVTRGGARQLTVDHSWVEEQVLAGRMDRVEAEQSPYRHMLTRSLGVMPLVEVDTFTAGALRPGDALVLCSDGVTNHVDADEFPSVIWAPPTAQAAAEALVDLAIERGGSDNATALVARVLG